MSKFWRQLDIIDPDKLNKLVTVIGAGSVGSFATFSMAKVGIKDITIYDDDKIEEHNLPNQFYRISDLGKFKVASLKEIISLFAPETQIKAIDCRWTKEKLSGVVVVAVDDMPTRKKIFEACKYNSDIHRLIDARMGGEVMRIYSINPMDPDDNELYEKTLYKNGEELPCTARTIIYNVEVIGGIICALAAKSMTAQESPREIVFDMKTWQYLTRR